MSAVALLAEVCRLADRLLAWLTSSAGSLCAVLLSRTSVNELAVPAIHPAGPIYIHQHTPAGISPELLLLHCSVPFMSLAGCQVMGSLQEVSGAASQACQSSQGRSVWQRSGCQGVQSSTWQWPTGATGKVLHTSGAPILPLTTDEDASLPESAWRSLKICWPTASHLFAEGSNSGEPFPPLRWQLSLSCQPSILTDALLDVATSSTHLSVTGRRGPCG